ncbi:NAD(P)/FAD-dependent oxidoreductase [Desulfovibrio sp. OttesenSCG-928-G15]|nr:NAD(P)/FAD-dependent oxidoreductase [Desulfovibrio sp. OttesenSCG-928-G15]
MKHGSGKLYDTIVLGAGASGLWCAAKAAQYGKAVLILDRAAKPGIKLTLSGGGKCNLTNRDISPRFYYGNNPDFCRSALSRLRPEELLLLLDKAGIAWEEREHGQLFCLRSAKDVRTLLVRQCEAAGCVFYLDEHITEVRALTGNMYGETPAAGMESQKNPASCIHESETAGGTIVTAEPPSAASRFLIRTVNAQFFSRNLVVATGGPAWPQCGASGFGYEIARSFGHRILPIRPALTGLCMPDSWAFAGLSGISLPASITVAPKPPDSPSHELRQKPVQAAHALPLLFTHNGISGPAALQASLYWTAHRPLVIDFLPDQSILELLNEPGSGKLLCRNLLKRHFPERLCAAIIPTSVGNKKTAELNKNERQVMAKAVHAHTVVPVGTEGFAKAEVTAGGIDTAEVSSKTMESKRQAGLFFCGEVLDVTGRLGGYNLHWAFASGNAAGEYLSK